MQPPPAPSDRVALTVCALLVLGVVLVFGQTARHEFVNFDDDRYVYDNDHVKPGLTLSGLGYYLVHRHSYTYHPVTSLSHMLDCQLFGQRAGGHHAMNVLLQATTVAGLFLVLWQMTGRLWPSAMVAAVFAVHPLRVESVAWISERRDVLSGLFLVLAIWAYVRYVRRPQSVEAYITLCVLYALGLLAKPMLVTLPPLLLLLDYWPLGRISGCRVRGARDIAGGGALREAVETPSNAGTPIDAPCETHHSPMASLHAPYEGREAGGPLRRQSLRRLLIEKIPLLAISLSICLVTVYTQSDGGAVQSLETVSWPARIANTPIAYANYVGSFFWPQRLAVLYPHPCDHYDLHDAILKSCLLAGASAVVALLWRRMPYLLVGWLWYLGTLVPVIGLLQVGGQSMADRYTYLPQIGLAIAAVWTATAAAEWLCRSEFIPLPAEPVPESDATGQVEGDDIVDCERPSLAMCVDTMEGSCGNGMNSVLRIAVRLFLALASVALLTALAAAAWRQTTYWRNSETLWIRELSFLQYNNTVAHYNYGLTLADHDRHAEAVQQYEAALKIEPQDEGSHLTLGQSYEALGSADAALEQYRAIVRDNPKSATGQENLARLLKARGDSHGSAEHSRRANEAEHSTAQ
jgi:hypothetical protein